MDGITIEPFDGDQTVADEIAALHLQIRLGQREDGTSNYSEQKLYSSQADLKAMADSYVRPGGNFWIARSSANGRIVGFVGLRCESENVGTLKRLAVLPEYRRHGIARKLVETLIGWAKERGFVMIKLGTGRNEKAHGLYLSAGFVDTGLSANGNDYLMRLDLTE